MVVVCASVYVRSYLEFLLDFLSKLRCFAQNLCPAPDSATSLHPIADSNVRYVNIIKVALFKMTSDPFIKLASDLSLYVVSSLCELVIAV